MNSTVKVLVPNREWLVKDGGVKIGGVSKDKKGYAFYKKGIKVNFKSLADINSAFGTALSEEAVKKIKEEAAENKNYAIYDFPCSSKPYEPVYNVKKKLPLFSKSDKSKCRYCAGYYVIKFKKGWVKSYCPKLITLDRYPFQGPFKTEAEMKSVLNTVNKQ
jgi:hypothetical protein